MNAIAIILAVAVSVSAAASKPQPKPAKHLVCGDPKPLAQGDGTVKACEWR